MSAPAPQIVPAPIKTTYYPTAWVQCDWQLENFGQTDPDNLIQFEGFPIEFTVEKNAYNKADTFEVKVDIEGFPFDPRIVRGGTVKVYCGAANNAQDVLYWKGLNTASSRAQCLIAGVVDEFEPCYDKEGRIFSMKGRDYTAYFLDSVLTPGAELKWTKDGNNLSITQILTQIIADRVTTAAITVDDRTPGKVGLTLQPATYRRRVLNNPKFSTRKNRHGEVVWDLIQELALEAGLIIYIELDQMVIAQPSTLFAGQGDSSRLLRWTVGENVVSWKPSRKLGRLNEVMVRVASYDSDTGAVLTAFSPKNAETIAKPIRVPASRVEGAPPKTPKPVIPPITPFVVRGITNLMQLQTIADQLRTRLRHHEMRALIETHEMLDSAGIAVQQMRYGDPVIFDLSENLRSTIIQPVEDQVTNLLLRGWEEADARKIAGFVSDLRVPFYLHSAKYSFSTKEGQGFKLEVEARSRQQVEV